MRSRFIAGLLLPLLGPALLEGQALSGAEYFVDSDPGAGSATPVSAVDGRYDSSSEAVEFSLNSASLAPGSHVVYVRMKDEEGSWGHSKPAAIYVVAQEGERVPTIATAEYFINSDPGEGQGTTIAGSFNSSGVELAFDIDSGSLPAGSNVLYLRMQDASGVWGRPRPAPLTVVSSAFAGEAPGILAAEYYIDIDPGEGSGTPVSGDFSGPTVSLEFETETSGLTPGSHTLNLRMQDGSRRWGQVRSASFTVEPSITTGQDAHPDIVAAEYFVDMDPGEGSGTSLDPADGLFDSTAEIGELETTTNDLAPGGHVLYVRMQDGNGLWGRPLGRFLQVRKPVADSQAEFRIIAAEYFLDADPGEGRGTPLVPSDGEWGGGLEDVTGQIESTDLSIGKHSLAVRMQDHEGTWGRTRTIEFTVDPPPPEEPEMVVVDVGPHDFGTQKIGTRSDWTFTVSNASGAKDTLKVRAVEVSEPFSASIESFELAPGRSQRVVVTFAPVAEGTFSQSLLVRSNGVESPQLKIRLAGQAVPRQPEMALSTEAADHDFGAVRIGSVGEWALVVANHGVDSLRVLSVTTQAPFGASPTEFDVPPGGEQAVRVTFEPSEKGTAAAGLHLRTNDPNQRQVEIALSGEGAEFGVPVVEVDTPAGEQAGAVGISFRITDDDDSDVDLSFAYEVAGTRRVATVSGVEAHVGAAQYKGVPLTVTWDTGVDLAGRDEGVRFVVTVSDADHPAGRSATTAGFQVDNNRAPTAVVTAPLGPVGRLIDIPFVLSDAENDPLTLVGEYSTDGGSSWSAATLASKTTDVDRYESSVLWNAFADLGYGRFATRFRLTPADNDLGTAAETDLQVVHWVADYDGDQDIDFDDVTLFLVAWNQTPKDVGADIGPCTGRVPDLAPVGDGHLDFEDVVVLIQMWNWSTGVHPSAKVADGQVGSEVLGLESVQMGGLTAVDVRLLEGTLLAADLEMDYDAAAWEFVEVSPGEVFANPAGLLLLKRETEPGQLTVQLGSLDGPATTTGRLLRLYFKPKGRGRERLWLRYDLRDGEGQRYASGSLAHRVRPVPEQYFLSPNMPNPFNPGTLIPYGLVEEALVDLTVYDILGRQVVQLVRSSLQESGYYRVSWNGRDARGQPVGSGLYLYRLIVRPAAGGPSRAYLRRMLLLR